MKVNDELLGPESVTGEKVTLTTEDPFPVSVNITGLVVADIDGGGVPATILPRLKVEVLTLSVMACITVPFIVTVWLAELCADATPAIPRSIAAASINFLIVNLSCI